jgi:hypothetical protein
VYDTVKAIMSISEHPKIYKRHNSVMMIPDEYLDLFIGVYETGEMP